MTDLGMMRDKGYDLLAYGELKFDEAQIKFVMADMWRYMNKLSDSLREIEKVINEKSETSNT